MSVEPSQEHIWSHFQNEGAQVFEGAHARLDYLLRLTQRRVNAPRPTILNIGVGDGYLERTAQRRGWFVHALDPDPIAVERLANQGVHAKTGVMEALPFDDNQFDAVIASEVLEHLTLEQRQKGLQEIGRALKHGGYFLGTVPFREVLEDQVAVCPHCRHVFHRWGHTTSFDLQKMRQELGEVFGEVDCRTQALVEFQGRSLGGKVKSVFRSLLGKLGSSIAVPNIVFVAHKVG